MSPSQPLAESETQVKTMSKPKVRQQGAGMSRAQGSRRDHVANLLLKLRGQFRVFVIDAFKADLSYERIDPLTFVDALVRSYRVEGPVERPGQLTTARTGRICQQGRLLGPVDDYAEDIRTGQYRVSQY